MFTRGRDSTRKENDSRSERQRKKKREREREVNNKAIDEETVLLHLWNRQKRRQIPRAGQDR